jgi:hypothetical protein
MPVKPRNRCSTRLGHTHRAYLWSYGTSEYDELPALIYDFSESRSGHHARTFLGTWSGKLVCDDCCGYETLFDRGIIELGCMAPARRKFRDRHTNRAAAPTTHEFRRNQFLLLWRFAIRAEEFAISTGGGSLFTANNIPPLQRINVGFPFPRTPRQCALNFRATVL